MDEEHAYYSIPECPIAPSTRWLWTWVAPAMFTSYQGASVPALDQQFARFADVSVSRRLDESEAQFMARIGARMTGDGLPAATVAIPASYTAPPWVHPHAHPGPHVTPGAGHVPQAATATPTTPEARRAALEARYPREEWMRSAEYERHLERMAEREDG